MCATPSALRATPYASGITNNAGTISFILNESADNVKVIFDGGGPGNTNDLGALPKGVASFSLGAHTSWEIHVTKSTAQVWTQISDDNNVFNQFYQPRSTTVNRNPASPAFGRVYVLEMGNASLGGTTASGRTINKGIYALNADLSDALGQGNTGLKGGLDSIVGENGSSFFFSVNSAYDPWKLVVGEDDYVYIPNANNPLGALARIDPNLTLGGLVLEGVGNTVRSDLHTVVYGVKVTGSLAAGTLSVLGIDGQWPAGDNYVLRWDINGGATPEAPLPVATVPTPLFRAGLAAEQDSDLDVDPVTGNIFVHFYRDVVVAGVPGLQVFSPSGTQLYTSVSGTNDAFRLTRSIRISPDGSKLAIFRSDRKTVILGLTNGVPDLSNSNLVVTFTQSGAITSRSVDWDAAGNLYVANNGNELLRTFSPGGSKTAITKSDGTFALVAPSTVVNVTAATPTANEAGPVNGVFTITRTGDLGLPLTVNYTMGGTATAGGGGDYVALPGSVTFQAGAISTNLTVAVTDDSEVEFTETAILTIGGSPDYAIGTGAATVNILDDEPATITLASATGETRLLEGYSAQKLSFTLTRKGLLSSALDINLAYSGTATASADYNAPASVALAADAVTVTAFVTPIDDDNYEGNETLGVAIGAGTGYISGTPSATNVTVIEDDYPAGTVLFADNFDTDSSGLWTVNAFDGANASATFAEDYSVTGYVPPSKPGGTTKGLVFRANLAANLSRNAISTSPTGLSLTGDYRLRFKAWNNYNGPLFQGGSGSTYHLTGGVGTTGDHAQFFFGTADGIWFDMSGDGASTLSVGDTSAYAGNIQLTGDYGVYAAADTEAETPRSSGNDYYSIWGGIQAPQAQVTAYSAQAGTSEAGAFGVSWHTVVIGYETNTVYWVIDGIPIAAVPDSFATLGPNVFVGWADNFNNSATSFPNPAAMSFGIIDDLRVETIGSAPIQIQITGIQIVGGNVEITFSGPTDKVATDFKLQSTATATGTFADDNAATLSDVGAGSFKATTALSGTSHFYKIKL
ncbi:MAG TPA: Calx-beta domain-containing protein [Verrucomicrobiae bacterium]|nr:Calx-beta domain-containing protein [Verrucomicrobiae bacterium]